MIRRAGASDKPLAHDCRCARSDLLSAHFARLWKTVRNACDASPLSIGVTACESGQGTSTVAANLAITAAASGWSRVLLLETNFDWPALAETFGTPREPGLADMLREEADAESCCYDTALDGLSLLPAGSRKDSEIDSPRAMVALLSKLLLDFSVVVCDLPVVHNAGHALDWIGRLDGVLLVMEPDRVAASRALRTKQLLEQSGARLLGLVLSKCPPTPSLDALTSLTP